MAKCAAGLHATILAGVVVPILVVGAYVFAVASEADIPMRVSPGWAKAVFNLAIIGAQAIVFVAFCRQQQRRHDAELSLRQFNEQIEIATATANLGLWSWCPTQDRVWRTPHCRKMPAFAGNDGAVFGFSLPVFRQRVAWIS